MRSSLTSDFIAKEIFRFQNFLISLTIIIIQIVFFRFPAFIFGSGKFWKKFFLNAFLPELISLYYPPSRPKRVPTVFKLMIVHNLFWFLFLTEIALLFSRCSIGFVLQLDPIEFSDQNSSFDYGPELIRGPVRIRWTLNKIRACHFRTLSEFRAIARASCHLSGSVEQRALPSSRIELDYKFWSLDSLCRKPKTHRINV